MKIIIKLANRYVLKEKIKTISAFIGIFLASFLVTTVIVLGGSLLQTVKKDLVNRYGEWHIRLNEADKEEQKKLIESDKVVEYSTKTRIGFVKEEQKKYSCLYIVSDNWKDMMHQSIVLGRNARAAGEIVVSNVLAEEYPDKYSLGCEGALEIGFRYSSTGDEITEYISIAEDERYEKKEKITYKVVGVYDGESRSSEGLYTEIYLYADRKVIDYTNIYAIMNNPNEVYGFGEKFSTDAVVYNLEYLSSLGISERSENSHDSIIFMCVVMVALIGIAAILLICNAFKISFNERIREFGLLVSVGANTKQVQLVMLLEGIIIALVAIPLGIALGIFTISMIVSSIGSMLTKIVNAKIDFVVYIPLQVICIVVSISILIVFIAILSPLRLARKFSLISLIRESYAKTLKVNIGYKRYKNRFSVERTIAKRTRKCYRRKYIASIASVSMSIILLLSSVVLLNYSMRTLEEDATSIPYDISINIHDLTMDTYAKWYERNISNNKKIKNVYGYASVEALDFSIDMGDKQEGESLLLDECFTHVECYIISNEIYNDILSGLESSVDNVEVIMAGYINEYKIKDGNYAMEITSIFSEISQKSITFADINSSVNSLCVPADKIVQRLPCFHENNGLMLFISTEQAKNWNIEKASYSLYIVTEEHQNVVEELEKLDAEMFVHNVAKDYETQKNTLILTEFFMKIFVILISLISIVNVYFTIITNIFIRKKELMVLKSLGLYGKNLYKLFFIECCENIKSIFAIAYSVSFAIAYLMFKGGKQTVFRFPIYEAVGCGIAVILLYVFTYTVALIKLNRLSVIEEINLR